MSESGHPSSPNPQTTKNAAKRVQTSPRSYRAALRPDSQVSSARTHEGKKTAKPNSAHALVQNVSAPQIAADTEAVKAILSRLLKPEAVDSWLHKKIRSLGLRTPVDLIRSGEVQQVIEMLARVEEGIPL